MNINTDTAPKRIVNFIGMRPDLEAELQRLIDRALNDKESIQRIKRKDSEEMILGTYNEQRTR